MEKNLSFKCIIIQNPCSNKRLPLKGLFGFGSIFVILNAHQMQSHRGIYLIFISKNVQIIGNEHIKLTYDR